jgi:hypothetical protein
MLLLGNMKKPSRLPNTRKLEEGDSDADSGDDELAAMMIQAAKSKAKTAWKGVKGHARSIELAAKEPKKEKTKTTAVAETAVLIQAEFTPSAMPTVGSNHGPAMAASASAAAVSVASHSTVMAACAAAAAVSAAVAMTQAATAIQRVVRGHLARQEPVTTSAVTETVNPLASPTSPRHEARGKEDPLPEGWEAAEDAEGRTYFIDHNSERTTYRHPSPSHTPEAAAATSHPPINLSPAADATGARNAVFGSPAAEHAELEMSRQAPHADGRTFSAAFGYGGAGQPVHNAKACWTQRALSLLPSQEAVEVEMEEERGPMGPDPGDGLGPLPFGWEKKFITVKASAGLEDEHTAYYVDNNVDPPETGHQDPRLAQSEERKVYKGWCYCNGACICCPRWKCLDDPELHLPEPYEPSAFGGGTHPYTLGYRSRRRCACRVVGYILLITLFIWGYNVATSGCVYWQPLPEGIKSVHLIAVDMDMDEGITLQIGIDVLVINTNVTSLSPLPTATVHTTCF